MSSAASQTPLIGSQPIGNFFLPDATQRQPLGSILAVNDTYYGGCEFIYLQAAGAIPTGSIVTWDATWQTTVCAATANTGRSVAFAGINPAFATGQYGWFQISGKLPVLCATTVAAGTTFGIHASTAGSANTNSAGRQVLGAVSVLAAAGTIAKTAQTKNGTNVLTVADASGWFQGLVITGTGIPASTIVGTVSADNRTVTMYQSGTTTAQNATATGSVTVTGTLTGYILAQVNRPFVQGAIT